MIYLFSVFRSLTSGSEKKTFRRRIFQVPPSNVWVCMQTVRTQIKPEESKAEKPYFGFVRLMPTSFWKLHRGYKQ